MTREHRCESIGCPDMALWDAQFLDYWGIMQRKLLCPLHRDQMSRHSWYRNFAFLFVLLIP